MNILEIEGKVENIEVVQGIIESLLEPYEPSPKILVQVAIAIEEIFLNICKYAYKGNGGAVKIGYKIENRVLTIQFIDNGAMFDPLTIVADTTSELEDRKIGGLGILMVKKSMDSMTYSYCNNQNILTITKAL